jgi:DNA-binding Lrp family transcriptional regulator
MVSDREFIDFSAKGLKIEAEPFKPLAESLGISVDEVIERIQRLIEEGKVRRFAASVRHQPMGYAHNAMIIAGVEKDHLDRVGEAASRISSVSHCYQRAHPDGDPNCIYIMVHGQDQETIEMAVYEIEQIPGIRSLEVCASTRELKKTSVSGVSTNLDEED